MIPILYEANETAFNTNGLGRLRDAISMEVTEERNGVYEASMQYPVDGAHYDLITPGRILYVTHDDTGLAEPFDIVGIDRTIEGLITVHAVHVSYRLTGMVASGTNINSLADAFTMLQLAEPTNPFTFTADFTATGYMASADGTPRSVRQFLGGVEGSVLDTYGGEYTFSMFNVTLQKQRGVVRDFTIRYGVNMTGYDEETDYTNTYTSCVPYWTGTDNTGATKVVKGNRVDLGATSYNGRNVCMPLDLTDKYENEPTTAQLEAQALAYMKGNSTNLPAQTIDVDFIRLQDMGLEDYSALLTCRLCDTIGVVFPYGNTTGTYKIVRTVWDVLEERYKEMTLGTLATTLAEALGVTEALERMGGGVQEPTDEVTEIGNNGDWAYRKWKSGAVEAWVVHSFGSQTGSAWGNVYYKELDLAIPSGIFTTAPNRVYITGSGRQWWVVGYASATTTSIQTIRFVRPASSASVIWANVYAVYLP